MVMSKSTLMAACAALVFVFAALYIKTGNDEKYYAETAVPWLERTMADIATWQAQALRSKLSPEASAVISDEQINALMNRFRRLGDFNDFSDLRFNRLTRALSLIGQTRISYDGVAVFSHGEAPFTVTLNSQPDGQFSMYNFNLGPIDSTGP